MARAFKVKKGEGLLRRVARAFKVGFREAQNKEWKCCQFQTLPAYKKTKYMKVREFGNHIKAEKFAEEKRKKGYNTFVQHEIAEFFGLVCEKPQSIAVVYYSKKPLRLIPETRVFGKSGHYSPEPICTPRGVFPKDLPVKERFLGA